MGGQALYTFEADDKSGMITEALGNHPSRVRFLAGAVPESVWGSTAHGNIHQLP